MRRGAASANARWGNTVAILTGDFLFARASDLLADLGSGRGPAAGPHLRAAGRRPDPRDRRARRDTDPIEHYLQVLADKTGSLIATSAAVRRRVRSRRRDRSSTCCARFGEHIGVAFQISDDILDIASESAESGKTPGTDLREGVATLPVLYALRSRRIPTDARLRELVSGPLADDSLHAEALRLLRASTALAEARRYPTGVRRCQSGDAVRAARPSSARRPGGADRRGGGPHQLSRRRGWLGQTITSRDRDPAAAVSTVAGGCGSAGEPRQHGPVRTAHLDRPRPPPGPAPSTGGRRGRN